MSNQHAPASSMSERFQIAEVKRRDREGRVYFERHMRQFKGEQFREIDFVDFFNLLLSMEKVGQISETLNDEMYISYNRFGDVSSRPRLTIGRHPAFGDNEIALIDYNGQAHYIVVPQDCEGIAIDEIIKQWAVA